MDEKLVFAVVQKNVLLALFISKSTVKKRSLTLKQKS